ncbi:MAG TPA: SLBB domain-containing protein [Chitinophagaceae bacterium]|nr:MAG: polysaccharide export protein [Bacteroidetes bacterium OLB11]HMN33505.1 SLBB domain-containing protein [Chitinophagaceae bacterium]
MKKFFLLILLAVPIYLFAQPNNNTNNQNNNPNPYNTNPYQNPYGNNIFLDQEQQKSPNFFDKNEQNKEQKNNSQLNQATDNPAVQNQKDLEKAFQDLNNKKTQDEQLLELYKNDPEYLKYLMATKTDIDVKSDTILSKEQMKEKVYGADFFSSNSFDLSDRAPSSPPLDYRLGPGDEVIVSLWNAGELQQSYTIGKDGSIFPRTVGKIYLHGLTLTEAQQTITTRFRKVSPSNTNIDVQLGKARTIRVTIIGEVKKPGTYTLSAFNDALNALFRSGGITDVGNLRKIEIIREGRVIDDIDIYKYLQNNNSSPIYLEDNDFIRVGIYEKKVLATGEFKRPMYYLLRDDEGLSELIDFTGGLKYNARNSIIQIKTVRNEEEQYININAEKFLDPYGTQNLLLRDGDIITVKPINEGIKNTITISGSVNYPDNYEFHTGDNLSSIINKAGGFKPNTFLPRAYITRGGTGIESYIIKVDLNNQAAADTISLQSGDMIKILSSKEYEQKFDIEVSGFVNKPGKISYHQNMTLKDVLLLAGGLRLDAENGRIEISNIVDSVSNYKLESKGVNIRIVSISSNLEIDPVSDNIIIKPLDRIYVRKKSDFINQQKVVVMGEVKYPGEYVLLSDNEKISSIIKRAGGLSKAAYSNGAKLFRKNIGPVIIELNTALNKAGNKQDLILKDGDELLIPQINEIVSVRGEVQQPINIKFDADNSAVSYYINASGGFGENPWKKRINVRYQNGKSKNTKNFLFFHFYPKVKQGSVVTVPQKPERKEKTKFSDVMTYTLSSLSTLATLVILSRTLKN